MQRKALARYAVRLQQICLQVGGSGDANICADALSATYLPCDVDVTPADAAGPIAVKLPLPFAVASFTADQAVITCAGDAATVPPISTPTESALAVALLFSDGKQRSIMDARASFSLDAASAPGCVLTHDVASNTAMAAAPGAPCAQARCIVNAAFPGLNASLSAQTTISVVAVEDIAVYSQPYNAAAACVPQVLRVAPVAPVLHPLACSLSDYEQTTLCAMAQLSAAAGEVTGRAVDVSAAATFATPSADVTLLPNLVDAAVSNRVRPTGAASTAVTATFGGVVSSPLAVTASAAGAAVYIKAFALEWAHPAPSTDSACGPQCSRTFSDFVGVKRPLAMSLELSDGYAYASGTLLGSERAENALLSIPAIFTFSSSDAAAISMGPAGDAQLLGNGASAVALQASTSCTAGDMALSDTLPLFANVRPLELDVDVGGAYGPPLQAGTTEDAVPGALQVWRVRNGIPQSTASAVLHLTCSDA